MKEKYHLTFSTRSLLLSHSNLICVFLAPSSLSLFLISVSLNRISFTRNPKKKKQTNKQQKPTNEVEMSNAKKKQRVYMLCR